MTADTLLTLTLIILFLPLFSFALLLAFGKRLPRKGDAIATGLMFLNLGLAVAVLFGVYALPETPAIHGFAQTPIQMNFKWIDFKTTIEVFGNTIPLQIELGLLIDRLVAIMLVVVTLITALVHLFSIGYMHGDPKYHRFFAYLGIFAFSMLGIVVTNNLLMMYAAWELVGLSSYLLIGFWYEKPAPGYAATKAFLMNRVGDIGMWIGIMILFVSYGTFRFDLIFAHIAAGNLPFGSDAWLTAAGILLFMGAIGKSAQFPLHTWLPDAMEGPTPVSALIHAATMVAAGVYLVARTFPLMSGDALLVIASIGTITAFVAATIAIVQNDIKKVLAYSTVSQLGYMILALGVGAFTAGFFHLVTHAMFKACLFLGSGSVIHAMHHGLHKIHDHDTDAQDIRNMGGLAKKMPVTFATFLIATLAISGVPLFSGFLSKDEILAGAWAFGSLQGQLAVLVPYVGFGVAALTAFYMFRLVILTFFGEPKRPDIHQHMHESPATMTIPIIVLASLSIWIFYSFNPFSGPSGWFVTSLPAPTTVTGSNWYPFAHGDLTHGDVTHGDVMPGDVMPGDVTDEAVAQGVEDRTAAVGQGSVVTANPSQEAFEHRVHESHLPAMIASLILALSGIAVAFGVYKRKMIDTDRLVEKTGPLYRFLLNKWYFDEIYEKWVVLPGVHLIARMMHWFDSRIVDGAVNGVATITMLQSRMSGLFDKWVVDGAVNGVAYAAGFFGIVLKKSQTGRIQAYIAFLLAGVVILFYVFR
ncbi:MAG: NADH-quinone oxidoreductase subunit L [Bacteroidetes bacterium]|nr:NADH-quinone oxidoreductase subunit L [Bacteroidota bacterium]